MIKLAAIDSEFGEITILKSRSSGSLLYYQGQSHQSETDSQGISLSSYIHAIYGLLLQDRCRDVLMIGCGGGTLATMLHAAGVKVTIVDINPLSFEIAREYFRLPDDVVCRVADGEAFLRDHEHRYDAIVLDAYEGGHIPPQFAVHTFFRLAQSRLVEGEGRFLVNICLNDDLDQTPDRFASLMNRTWDDVRVLEDETEIDRNAIVVAGAVAALEPPTMLVRPESRVTSIARELKNMHFRAWHLP